MGQSWRSVLAAWADMLRMPTVGSRAPTGGRHLVRRPRRLQFGKSHTGKIVADQKPTRPIVVGTINEPFVQATLLSQYLRVPHEICDARGMRLASHTPTTATSMPSICKGVRCSSNISQVIAAAATGTR